MAKEVLALQAMWNGNLRAHAPMHFCDPGKPDCCKSREQSVQRLGRSSGLKSVFRLEDV